MCSHYIGEQSRAKLARMGVELSLGWQPLSESTHFFPNQMAPIIRRPPHQDAGDEAVPAMELVPANFGLLPSFAKDIKYGLRTYNARSETAASLVSFKSAWAKGRHCIVPASAIYEPDWRSGKHVPVKITHVDGETLGVAGLWQPWKSPAGEWMDTFAMMTINADTHEIFKELHRPDPKRAADRQDKRMVVILNKDSYDAWLDAPAEQTMDFMRQCPAKRLTATPEPKEPAQKQLL
ncbi:MAG: SOS response-associated peptidase [Pseudomonadota bacterium]